MKRSLVAIWLAALLSCAGVAAAADGPTTIHIRDFHFVPASLTISTGTTVTFVNDDEEPHTATAVDKAFDSGALDTHDTWKHTFATPGAFAYFCEMHPQMKGKLIVKAAE